MGDTGVDRLTLPLTPPLLPTLGVIPRPDQLGAMQFDDKNITEFLEEWNIECEDFDIDKVKRYARFPNYCVDTIKDTIKLLPGGLDHPPDRRQETLLTPRQAKEHNDSPR